MPTLWNELSSRVLIQFLDEYHPNLLEQLDGVLPALVQDQSGVALLDSKPNLSMLFSAFADSECLTDRKFLKTCLLRIKDNVLSSLLGELGEGDHERSHEQAITELLRISFRDPSKARVFVDFFDLPNHFMPARQERRDDYLLLDPPTGDHQYPVESPFKQLKRYQFQVYFDALDTLDAERSRLLIQMPTGSGKTRTAMELICSFLNAGPEAKVVVWLAHSEELCEQAFQCFLDVWPHLATKPVTACRYWSRHNLQPRELGRSYFVVSTFQKLHAAVERLGEDGRSTVLNKVDLVVVDEAHKTKAPTYEAGIRSLISDETRVVGLTATPGRTDEIETRSLATFFHSERVSIVSRRESDSTLSYLRKIGVLASVDFVPLRTSASFSLTAKDRRYLAEKFELPPSVLARLGDDQVRNIEILRRLINEAEGGKRILFFGCSVQHSRFIAALLMYLGVSAAHLDGSTGRERRSQLIRDFLDGNLQVLCNFGVLTTGFDAPKIDVVFISRPTGSVVLYSQMVGRGLRGPAIGGTSRVRVIDVRDNIIGFGDEEAAFAFFDDYWAELRD